MIIYGINIYNFKIVFLKYLVEEEKIDALHQLLPVFGCLNLLFQIFLF